MLSDVRLLGVLLAFGCWCLSLLTSDCRWAGAALALMAGAGIAHLAIRWQESRELAADERFATRMRRSAEHKQRTAHAAGTGPAETCGGDVYWTDAAEAAAEAVDGLTWSEMVARFAALDMDPMVRSVGRTARRRERVWPPMRSAHHAAWTAIARDLHEDIPSTPRCTCGVMRGVLTPSRSCPFHGTAGQ